MASEAPTKIRLQSNDNAAIEVGKLALWPGTPSTPCPLVRAVTDQYRADRQVAERSLLIKNMLEDLGDAALDQTIPIVSNQGPRRMPRRHSISLGADS